MKKQIKINLAIIMVFIISYTNTNCQILAMTNEDTEIEEILVSSNNQFLDFLANLFI